METIHDRIRARRKQLELSLEQVAKGAGVKAWQTVQQWEKAGGTAPSRKHMAKVAETLKTTEEYLRAGGKADVAPAVPAEPDTIAEHQAQLNSGTLGLVPAHVQIDLPVKAIQIWGMFLDLDEDEQADWYDQLCILSAHRRSAKRGSKRKKPEKVPIPPARRSGIK